MNTPPSPIASIRDRLGSAPARPERFLWGAAASVSVSRLLNGTNLAGRAAELAGRSVLVATQDQFAAALAFVELDGIARRLIVCTPDLPSEHLPGVVAKEARMRSCRITIAATTDRACHLGFTATAPSRQPKRRSSHAARPSGCS